MRLPVRRLLALLCLCAAALLSSCASYYESERQWADMLVSPQAEAVLGTYLAGQYEGSVFIPLNDPESDAYLASLGERMRASSAPCAQQFKYKFVADPAPNAFAVPGGHVYVTSGLMQTLESESELAAVIGHEVNHVVNRHGVRGLLREQWVNGMAQLVARAAGGDSEDREQVGGVTQAALAMHMGRDMEREADDTGIDASYRAGFHPAGAVGLFQKFRAMEGGRRAAAQDGGAFESHPDPAEREATARAKIAQLPLHEGLTRDSAEFHRIRERVIKLAAKAPARPKPSESGFASAWCGMLPPVAMPQGGLAAFGIRDPAYYPPPDCRSQQPTQGQTWRLEASDDEEDEEEDEDDEDW